MSLKSRTMLLKPELEDPPGVLIKILGLVPDLLKEVKNGSLCSLGQVIGLLRASVYPSVNGTRNRTCSWVAVLNNYTQHIVGI